MVFLSACHGGVETGQTASFAEELLRAGVPFVLAMQTSVSDYYATQLAQAFYRHLSSRELLLPSRALAQARRALEQARLTAVQRGESLTETQPEYATATLFVATEEEPQLADFAANKVPLRERPLYEMPGPVPHLRIDDLIGRRKELRETLGTLRDPKRAHAGVMLTGIGGVGKSALAGRVMMHLAGDAHIIAAHVGPWDIQSISAAIGAACVQAGRQTFSRLLAAGLEDNLRLQLLAHALALEPILLVLDDFESNLTEGGTAFRDEVVAEYLTFLLKSAQRGRILITCRYPVPGFEEYLQRIAIGPLSRAESRKLLRRLDHLNKRGAAELEFVLRVVGGHPRMLEFLDAVLAGGRGRLAHVTEKLRKLLRATHVELDGTVDDLDESLRKTLLLGTRDVFLSELLTIVRSEAADGVLFQLSVSNLPVTPAGIVHMLADGPVTAAGEIGRTLRFLENLSLVHRFSDGSVWVHRWTAEGLAGMTSPEEQQERANRAGRYRWWRAQNESQTFEDAWEAVRNHLSGEDFDAATGIMGACFDWLLRSHQSATIAALATEVLQELPVDHADYGWIADAEAQAYLALGFTANAFHRYEALLRWSAARVDSEPDRADYQRDLSVSYERMGDLYVALGQGEQARVSFQRALEIRERLASAEPDRADYQRDLSVSLVRVGQMDDSNRQACLSRALAILKTLEAGGRLNPTDKPLIEAIDKMLG